MSTYLRRLFLVALMVIAVACGGDSNDTADDSGFAGIELERLEGGSMLIAEPGPPRALNLWATWCAPCRAELPAFDAVAADLVARSSEISIIGINVGDSGADATELVEELGLSFEQLLDPKASVQRELRITGMPATIFVDDTGEILDIHNGELTQDELEALLRDLFGAAFDGE